MSRYETEEEQIEAIKSWWKKNGTQVLSAVLVVVIAVSGWRYWNNSKFVDSANGSALFELLQANMQQGTFGEVSREALKLVQEQPESPYAAGAALLYAKYSFEKGDIEDALTQLQWVADHSTDATLQNTAKLRQARIYVAEKDYTKAESSLKSINAAQLGSVEKANYDYVVGLTALAKADDAAAVSAFQAVVDNQQAEKNLLGLAQIQLDDLAK